MKIGKDTFVSLIYALTVDGQVVDSTTKENPLQFPFGEGYLLPKFEAQIAGLGAGDKFDFTLSAADGYGEVAEQAIVELPETIFMIDGKVEDGLLVVGNQIPMSTPDGQRLVGVVREVADGKVRMDFNHPMAGKTLHFMGEIVEVREASDDDCFSDMDTSGCNCDSCDNAEKGGCGGH
ncbi:MAG: peptidylprolyl isomerase [Rikenellaceae bacterium]|nr:peptidylprolyl isomerase [Rikenellaceae bacterium]MCL2693017.1 peptidylprolyl isomerase [Rikenellaceae bacterium]